MLYSWIGRFSIVMMTVHYKLINRFSEISVNILAGYFVKTEKLIVKFIWQYKGPRNSKTTLKKKKSGELKII